MLACLVAIPLVAVFGGTLPEKLEALVSSYLSPAGPASGGGQGEPARFQPMQAAAVDPAMTVGRLTGRSSPTPAVAPAPTWGTGQAASAPVIPAGYEMPMARQTRPGGGVARGVPAAQGAAAGGVNQQPRPLPTSSEPPRSAPTDPFTAMQTRLQQLGATYVLLESIGNRQEVYRCYCRVAIGGDPSYAYYFEAIDSAPLTAMSQVVRQVEQWRARRP
jgi:hypothetical protein